MKIFRVYKNQQERDSDGWNNWIQEIPISYHQTKLGASNAVLEQINKMIESISLDDNENYRNYVINFYRKNIEIFSIGKENSLEHKELPIFDIEEIDVLPDPI